VFSLPGLTAPHPNAACIILDCRGNEVSRASQRANGTTSAEVLATRLAGDRARGGVAYLNLEPGDCHGDLAATEALISSGVQRVVIGLKHPLRHARGKAIQALRAAGLTVDVLLPRNATTSTDPTDPNGPEAVRGECLLANEALLMRAWARKPFSVLKYAMTLDGKIATTTMHSAWVSSPESRARVFEMRGRSDAVIVGGNTVRRDNPRLTTRREGGHTPARIVLSRTMDLPQDANLWDVSLAPTIVMTQRGVRQDFQAELRRRGVEVVEFDFLTPTRVAEYCYDRGFLRLLWECGGMLAAPAIQSGVIHQITSFIAPKVIGGCAAPTPCGDMGFVEMTQALRLVDYKWETVGPDVTCKGYLESACPGLDTIDRQLDGVDGFDGGLDVDGTTVATTAPPVTTTKSVAASVGNHRGVTKTNTLGTHHEIGVVAFYKAWDAYGCLNNFSPHPIVMSDQGEKTTTTTTTTTTREWKSVEHYYQAQKFQWLMETPEAAEAAKVIEEIYEAESPEEAARLGRKMQRMRPTLVRPDWVDQQVDIMCRALRAKYTRHKDARMMLLGTKDSLLCEASPNDFFWGRGRDGSGKNMLGRLLMALRKELMSEYGVAGDALDEAPVKVSSDAASSD